jgi:uncharacterized protein (DUF849 family)
MHSRKTIITCAVTGNITKPEQHPGLPITPAQIATASLEAARAGAAAVHIHVRDPGTGRPSMDVALYREVIERIRAVNVDLIINLTTGPGGRFIPSDDDPRVAAPGTTLLPPERRVEHILELEPDICSLDLNTMNSGGDVVINTPKNVTRMANVIREAGVKPELEIFDSGDLHLALDLIKEGVLDGPGLWTLVMGVKYGFSASPETLLYARRPSVSAVSNSRSSPSHGWRAAMSGSDLKTTFTSPRACSPTATRSWSRVRATSCTRSAANWRPVRRLASFWG